MATIELMALGLTSGIVLFATHFMLKNKLIKGIILLFLAMSLMLADLITGNNVSVMILPASAILILISFYMMIQGYTGRDF